MLTVKKTTQSYSAKILVVEFFSEKNDVLLLWYPLRKLGRPWSADWKIGSGLTLSC